jgi:PIN domain nuclease of toxin-antitoxin system
VGSAVTVLLDTATLIWALTEPARLTPEARAALDADGALLVSSASAWEITTKHRLGRLPAVTDLVNDWDGILDRFGLGRLPITHTHALRAGSFPVDHADPFDRMLAAQSELDDIPLVSPDHAFDRFPVRRVW